MLERRYRWIILVVGILAYATSQFSRQNYAGIQKFMADELVLDKGALGLLGSVFFYSYALFQMPWGLATDRWGARWVVGLGIVLTAVATWGFSIGHSLSALLTWRVISGIGGAAVYGSLAGGMARWFPARERGVSQAALGGVGGALGESAAFFLLPVISIYLVGGWRQGTAVMAAATAAMGVLCLILLRSAPADSSFHASRPAPEPFTWSLLRDPQLWCYTFLFSAFIIAIRVVQPWIALYAADVYINAYGQRVNAAVVAGGTLVIVAYSLLGRGVGCPIGGRLSDALVKRGISRATLSIGWLALALVLFQVLSRGVTTAWILAAVACLLGTSINLFTLISAAIAETYGVQRTASIVSFANTVAQLLGATALAASGYVGVSLGSQAGHDLTEYRGVWLTAMTGTGIAALVGTLMHLALTRGWGWRAAPAVQPLE
jgi:MFS transporter, OPA family, sugar phosphate sensor protein UhpC